MNRRDQFIEDHSKNFEVLLKKLITIRSFSVTGEGIEDVVKFLTNLLKKLLHADIEVIPTKGHPIIIAKLTGTTKRNVLLYGHYDVMAAGDISKWQSDPFTLSKREGRFYGRGVGDNKGQLLAQILGVYSYLELHQTLPFNVGSFGNIMTNPVTQLFNFLIRIYDVKTGQVKIPHFYDGILEPTAGEKEWIAKLPFNKDEIIAQAGINQLAMDKFTYYHKLMFEPTFNIFGIKGGYLQKGVKTSIPHEASLKVDCRLVDRQDISVIKENLLKVYQPEIASGQLQVSILGELPPEKTSATSEQIEWLYQAIKRATGKAYIEPVMPGSVPNYVWKNFLKVPVFTIPYANADERNHDIDENMTIKNFYNGIRISYEILSGNSSEI
ncbi:M20/M25/M40 family metallo-hydrolase [Companilactobacillus paralimentarius]|uniref:M20/M25/M40 family metallo-hydrolase n=1 Tax=Companilactobacillus paralimentarius TaxID=83526 RepID=UPI00070511E4|nr:M20/M25/M40 family metallo-hydrolase [Companilactobacillus paralimentarius]KAE9565532.1 hypothetical protein ATN96_02965 [Companilactobacillus paralimentarius]